MKLLVYFTEVLIISISFMVVCSCGGNNRKVEYEGNKVEEENVPDSMVRAVLDDFTDDSLYVTIQHNKQKMTLGYFSALNKEHVKGTLVKGHLYSVLPNSKNRDVDYLVNLTELCSKWFYDFDQHRGMTFELKGALSPINPNPEDVSFRRWMLRNGQLLIFYVYMQQEAKVQREFEVDDTEIVSLSPEELTFRFRGKMLQCKHMKETIKFHPQDI